MQINSLSNLVKLPDGTFRDGQRKRILYVFNVSWFFLSHRTPVAIAAQNLGFEIHVAASIESHDLDKIKELGFKFHPLPLSRRGLNPLREIITILSLFKLYYTLRPDLSEHATIKPVLYGSLIAKLFRSTSTVNWMTGLGYVFIQDSFTIKLFRSLLIILYRFTFNRDKLKIIFENDDDRTKFIDNDIINLSKSIVIKGAGVNITSFSPSNERSGDIIIILPARMLWDKGVGEFVEAAKILKSSVPLNTRFVLVGDTDEGNPASVSKQQLDEWVNHCVIEWWGKRHDMSEVYSLAHIVCLPSYREGLPKVLLEAAASSRPIVTTDVPGCREVVKDGVNGLLVPVKDSVALANALHKLIEDKDLREKMGQRGREIVLNGFSEEKIVAETMAVYQELLLS